MFCGSRRLFFYNGRFVVIVFFVEIRFSNYWDGFLGIFYSIVKFQCNGFNGENSLFGGIKIKNCFGEWLMFVENWRLLFCIGQRVGKIFLDDRWFNNFQVNNLKFVENKGQFG